MQGLFGVLHVFADNFPLVAFQCRRFVAADGGIESFLFKDYSLNCNSARYKVCWSDFTVP